MASGLVGKWLTSLSDVFLPRHCAACNKVLAGDEKYICQRCLVDLPRTQYEDIDFNAFEQRFAGIVPIERAVSYFFYEKKSPYASILHNIKYYGMPELGVFIAQKAARDMKSSGCFDGIDYIIPVPLHFTKLAQRGYNQSEMIAKGVSHEIDAPVVNALKALHSSGTQTHKTAQERLKNTTGLFSIKQQYVKKITGKHVLLVDDVVTTGATLISCALALKHATDVKISLFTLAAAHLD